MLANAGATALDDDAKQNNENYSGNNTNDHYIVHFDLLSFSFRNG
jgi:hypothetical protein